jgi:hypothetical protein
VELCLGLVLSETSYYTRIILQHLTNKQIFFSHHTTSHLTRSEKLPLHQRQFVRSNYWTLDHWMLGGPVAGVTPCFFALTVPNQFKYLVWGQEPGSFTHTHHILLPEDRLFTRLEQVAMPYHFSCFMDRLFTDQSLHFYTSTLHICNQSGICL